MNQHKLQVAHANGVEFLMPYEQIDLSQRVKIGLHVETIMEGSNMIRRIPEMKEPPMRIINAVLKLQDSTNSKLRDHHELHVNFRPEILSALDNAISIIDNNLAPNEFVANMMRAELESDTLSCPDKRDEFVEFYAAVNNLSETGKERIRVFLEVSTELGEEFVKSVLRQVYNDARELLMHE